MPDGVALVGETPQWFQLFLLPQKPL
jgi:hypothetical protein